MNAEFKQVKQVFLAALDRASPEAREAFLSEVCAANDLLRRQVEALIQKHEQAGSFLESPPADLPPRPVGEDQAGATCEQSLAERPGTQIGPYKLLQQIGEGGMGTVYMAEQTQPVQRKVALKLIKPGMDSRQVIARFEAERQALAMMDHVNIARVFDGGTTGDSSRHTPCAVAAGETARTEDGAYGTRSVPATFGRPYFVMELVHGVPITKYCDDNHLTPRERLELFVPVCQAIQHAHQKGIIHRDIKPSNVMVTLYDGKPVPKVIDFGVAKATEQKLTERTLFTQYGTMVGTLEYMSPEQAEMSALGVDTRSDIYSLGVLLYELLTGSTPLTHKRMKEAAYAEILRMIKEEEPPKPSTRLSDSGEALASISANRHTEPAKLTKLVKGELDWIVMKTLEKDRNRRYETANAFAADVQRYLADEQVLACPPSAGYRLRKFLRRNKAGLAVVALVLFFLVLLGGGAGWAVRDRASQHAEFERQRLAQQAEAERAKFDRQQRLATQAELILDDVDRLEREQKWDEALAVAKRAEAAVAGGDAGAETAQRVRQRLKDLEFIDRLEQIRMQRATSVEGEFDSVSADWEYAKAFHDYGADVLAVAASIHRLKARPALAIPLAAALDDWIDLRRGDLDVWSKLVAIARGIDPEPVRDRLRATWGRDASETQDELRRLADSIDMRAQHPATLVSLARTLQRVGHWDPAIHVLQQAQSIYPGDFWLNFELGMKLNTEGDYEGATRFLTAAVSLRPNSAVAQLNLGNSLGKHGKSDEAIACYRTALELDPKYAYAYSHLGTAQRNQGKLDEAIAAYRKATDLEPNNFGDLLQLGRLLREQKKLVEANAVFDEAIAASRRAIQRDSGFASPYHGLGSALREQNKLDEAIAAYRKAIELDPKLTSPHVGLGNALLEQKKLPEAIAAYGRAIELDPKSDNAYFNLGNALRAQGTLDEAVAAYRKAIELGPTSTLATSAYFGLGQALTAQKNLPEAVAAYRKAIELDPKYTAAGAYINIGKILSQQNRPEEAIAAYRKAIEVNQEYANAAANSSLALILSNCSDIRLRDPVQAVVLARKAVELSPKSSNRTGILGLAHYRAGDWKAAIAALEKSMELGKGGDCNEWLVLAMAHWQLGEQDKARQWYDKAVAWMDKNQPKNEELRRFRSEAEEVMSQ